MKTNPIKAPRKRLVWRVLATACLVVLTGIATLTVQTVSAPKAHAQCSSNCPPTSQLVFKDYRGDVYSIRVLGTNQNADYTQSPCWQTPGFETTFHDWWWASDTVVYLYHTSDCGAYIGYLTINSDGAWYRCLQDTYPYPDYDCNP